MIQIMYYHSDITMLHSLCTTITIQEYAYNSIDIIREYIIYIYMCVE